MAARRLVQLGATLIDADAISRDVVEPDTPGLRAVVDAFGRGVLNDDGGLDRAALGARVFDDAAQRERLNAIIHPLVRARAAELMDSAGQDAIVVQDIPLLVETGQGPDFHLVVVVDAPEAVRIRRMIDERGMSAADAESRIRAQASDMQRREAADVLLDNTGTEADLEGAIDELWHERLLPFRDNLLRSRPAPRPGPAELILDDGWAPAARRLAARLERSDRRILAVDHIGSTAVHGLPAKDVIDLQVTVRSLADADAAADQLTGAGFPPVPGALRDTPKPSQPDTGQWGKRLHSNADPGRPANVHVRTAGSPGWRYALAFRDWMRADAAARADYLREKQRVAAAHAADRGAGGYAAEKDQWFTTQADERLNQWINESGWTAPRY